MTKVDWPAGKLTWITFLFNHNHFILLIIPGHHVVTSNCFNINRLREIGFGMTAWYSVFLNRSY